MNTPSSQSLLERTVIQQMEEANARRVVPHTRILRYQQVGEEMVFLKGTETPTSTAVLRHATISDAAHARLVTDWYHETNFVYKFKELCAARARQRAFAMRPVLRVSREFVHDAESGSERELDVTYLGESVYTNYGEAWDTIENFGRGLRELGVASGSRVCIYLETRLEWLLSAYGVWSQGMVLTTVYANLGEEALIGAFTETNCGAIITVKERIATLVRLMQSGAIPHSILLSLDGMPTGVDLTGVQVKEWQAVVDTGSLSAYAAAIPTDADALALIMYTSGTTGGPKGVMHTYGSITAGINGMSERLNYIVGPVEPDERYCAMLPLAHIFEFSVVNIFLTRGCLIGFGTPRTLLSTFARPHGDLEEFQPMLIIGVPRIFDNFKKTMEAYLPPRSSLERKIFDHAFASRLKYMREGMDTPFWNEVVFAPFRKMLGGRTRCLFGGGGPISGITQTFMNVVCGGFIQGYGLTETIANASKQLMGDLETNIVGPCEIACEIKLVDTEDYKHTDLPEPRGEICLRGPYMFKGYYKKEAQTREVLTEDGWFHTGDVGSIAPRGRLRVISRIKSLAKNSLGEYIAMEALESLYNQNDLVVPNGCCVLVQPNKNYICAIACTSEVKAMNFIKKHNADLRNRSSSTVSVDDVVEENEHKKRNPKQLITATEWPALLRDVTFQRAATEALRKTAILAARGTQEIVRYVHFSADTWTPENGVLTAAGKLKRQVITTMYKDVIQELFSE